MNRRTLASLGALAAALLTGGCLTTRPTADQTHQSAVDLYDEGLALERQGRWREAAGAFERSLAIADTPAAHYHLGRSLMQLGELDSAENHLERALELSPSYGQASNTLLQLQEVRRTGEAPVEVSEATPEAQSDLDAILTPHELPSPRGAAPPAPDLIVEAPSLDEIASRQEGAGEAPNFVAGARASEEVDDAEAEALIREAEAAARVEAPEVPMEPAGPTAPDRVAGELRTGTGAAPGEMPSLQETRQLLFPHLHVDPSAPSGAQRLAETQLRSPEFHLAQATAFENEQDYVNALREYRIAFNLDSTQTNAVLAMARIHGLLGHEQEALAAFERALEVAPGDPEVPFQLGNHFFRRGEHARAVTQFERAIAINPNHKNAHNNLGAALRELGRFDEAIGHLNEALRIDPAYAPPHRNLGNIYADQGRNAEALRAYQEYIRLGGQASDEVQDQMRELRARTGTPGP